MPNNPAYLLILAGIPLWWKRDRNSALVTLAVLAPSLLLQSTFADWAGGCSPAGGRYMMPYVFCAIPVVAFLYAELKWLFRTLMASLILLQVAFGVYNARMDHVCSYAGDNNPMLVSFAETHQIRPDLAMPIFSQDLNLNGGTAAIQLIIGIGVILAMLLGGVIVAQRKRTEAQAATSENV